LRVILSIGTVKEFFRRFERGPAARAYRVRNDDP
jgi:hypothetical protein